MCATTAPEASFAMTCAENVVLTAAFDGSRESTASAVEPAGTVSCFADSVYAAESLSVARSRVTSSVPLLR